MGCGLTTVRRSGLRASPPFRRPCAAEFALGGGGGARHRAHCGHRTCGIVVHRDREDDAQTRVKAQSYTAHVSYIYMSPLIRQDLSTRRGVFAALTAEPVSADRGTVLLLPGYAKDKEDFLPLLPLLCEAGYRAVAVDLRGQNETPGGDDVAASYQREELSADILALAEALGASAHLVGHSMGGQIARGAALADPSAFASLTLLSSGPAEVGEERRGQVTLLTGALTTMTMEQAWPALQRLRPQQALSPDAEARRERWLRTSRTHLLATGRNLLDEPDRTEELARLDSLPMHVLHGDRDDTWAPFLLADMARRLGARHTVLAQTGHSPHVQRPQATAEAMTRFWEGVPVAASEG